MNSSKVQEALVALVAAGASVAQTQFYDQFNKPWVDATALRTWSFSLAALLESAFGPHHHFTKEVQSLSTQANTDAHYQCMLGVAKAADLSWRAGYVFDSRALIRADVESDLIGQAQDLLNGGYDRPAAVLAGCVLETHLRDIAPSWGVPVTDAKGKHLTLGPLAIELKKAGAFDGIMQKRIDLTGSIRNEAAHGNPFENRSDEVRRMIADVLDTCGKVVAS